MSPPPEIHFDEETQRRSADRHGEVHWPAVVAERYLRKLHQRRQLVEIRRRREQTTLGSARYPFRKALFSGSKGDHGLDA